MGDYLHIEVTVAGQAAADLTARLSALRPQWDIELNDNGLVFQIPAMAGKIDRELTVLEECCRIIERVKSVPSIDINIYRSNEDLRANMPPPLALGPWELCFVSDPNNAPLARPERILAPADRIPSKRFATCEALMLAAISAHLTPPPGAPETRGGEALIMESVFPAGALACLLAGAAHAVLVSDEESAELALELARLNAKSQALEIISSGFKKLSRQKSGSESENWIKRFGLIALHISPYIAARRLAQLSAWLAPEGVLIIAGFAPGPQTALLLRSAAKAGLCLMDSINEGNWAAMILSQAPQRPQLPPIDISLVPRLEELPPDEKVSDADGPADDAEKEILDENSLMADELDDEMPELDDD